METPSRSVSLRQWCIEECWGVVAGTQTEVQLCVSFSKIRVDLAAQVSYMQAHYMYSSSDYIVLHFTFQFRYSVAQCPKLLC